MKDVKDPNRVRFVGPLAEYADGFRRELGEYGFAPASATRQLELMANVSRWLADGGLVVGELTPRRVEMFVIARREAGFRNRARPDRLVRYLRSVGAVPELPPGDQWYWRGDFVRERPDETARPRAPAHARYAAQAVMPSCGSARSRDGVIRGASYRERVSAAGLHQNPAVWSTAPTQLLFCLHPA